jgi:hypothetical protein
VDGSQRLISASLEVPETLERVFKMERGCVDLSAVALAKAEDQPQHVKDSESLENSKALRLVEDDTAVLPHFSNTLLAKQAGCSQPACRVRM